MIKVRNFGARFFFSRVTLALIPIQEFSNSFNSNKYDYLFFSARVIIIADSFFPTDSLKQATTTTKKMF